MKTLLIWFQDFLRRGVEEFRQLSPLKQIGTVVTIVTAAIGGVLWVGSHIKAMVDDSVADHSVVSPTPTTTPQSPAAPPTPVVVPLTTEQKVTKLAAWKKVKKQTGDLVAILDRGDKMLETWLADFQSNPTDEIKKAQEFASDANKVRLDLEASHNIMTGDQAEIGALVRAAVRPPGAPGVPGSLFDQWQRVTGLFSSDLALSQNLDRQNLEDRMGATAQQLQEINRSIRKWQQEISATAQDNIKSLTN